MVAPALADITIVYPDGSEMRFPHLTKHDIDHSTDLEETETYDEDLVDKTKESRKFSLSGIRVDRPDILSEATLYNKTNDLPINTLLIAKDGDTKYTYYNPKRSSFKASRDGKKRPTRDLEFSAADLKVEDI